jgi:hypothetical protein
MNDDAFCFLLAVVTYKASWKQSLKSRKNTRVSLLKPIADSVK